MLQADKNHTSKTLPASLANSSPAANVVQRGTKVPSVQSVSRREFAVNMLVSAASVAAATSVSTRAPAIAAVAPDPVFAAIEAFRCAVKRASDAIAASDDGMDDETSQVYHDARRGLLTTMPTTIAGLATLLTILGRNEWKEEEIAGGSYDESVYSGAIQDVPEVAFTFFERLADHIRTVPLALAGITAGATAGLAASAVQACTLPDPIFAAIERHRRAWDDLNVISDLTEAAENGDKNAELKADQLHEAVNNATDRLLDVVPTTIAGVSALLDYAAEYARVNGNSWPRRYVLEDGYASLWEKERGVTWEVYLHKHLAKALPKIATAI